MDLVLNNLQRLICHKTNQTNKQTNQYHLEIIPKNKSDLSRLQISLFSEVLVIFLIWFPKQRGTELECGPFNTFTGTPPNYSHDDSL